MSFERNEAPNQDDMNFQNQLDGAEKALGGLSPEDKKVAWEILSSSWESVQDKLENAIWDKYLSQIDKLPDADKEIFEKQIAELSQNLNGGHEENLAEAIDIIKEIKAGIDGISGGIWGNQKRDLELAETQGQEYNEGRENLVESIVSMIKKGNEEYAQSRKETLAEIDKAEDRAKDNAEAEGVFNEYFWDSVREEYV